MGREVTGVVTGLEQGEMLQHQEVSQGDGYLVRAASGESGDGYLVRAA